MQGYILPLALAALLAAPVVWRLGDDIRESPAVLADGDASEAAPALSLTSFALHNNSNAAADQSGQESDRPAGAVQVSTTPTAHPSPAEE
ncbi:MAG: hypothetical protein ACFCUQ_20125 [Kiloniellales bacterium]